MSTSTALMRTGAALLLCAGVAGAVAAAPAYRLVNLDGFQSYSSHAAGISENGLVTGSQARSAYEDENQLGTAFLYDGAMRSVGTLGGYSSGTGVNSRGQLSMASSPSPYIFDSQPVRYDAGVLSPLGPYGRANAINEQGQVAGAVTDTPGSSYDAFVHDEHGLRRLGSLGGDTSSEGTDSVAQAINDNGQVAGYSSISDYGPVHAFLHDGSTMHDLGTLGGSSSWGYGINAAGHVTGVSVTGDDRMHAFLHDGEAMRDLGTLGGAWALGADVNSFGEVVGSSYVAEGGPAHAFLFDGEAMLDLNLLLDGSGDGWLLMEANAINDDGLIVGRGFANGGYHAYLLIPVPEPGTYVLLLAGLAVIGWRLSTRPPTR